jgi:flagellin
MSLGVLNNLSAIYAENNLNNSNNSLNTVLQQLSSGSKINSGADDAAGLSLVDGLQANNQALMQSQTNASEGVGLLTVADGALSQVTNLLNRAVTLATEASNGTLNASQDTAANQEYQSILSEISNIGTTTTYNNQAVFNSNTNIYTGDSSTTGASIDSLNIRTLSSTNVGDSGGAMAYSTGANGSNVFVDLSNDGKAATVNDSLGLSTAETSIQVDYLQTSVSGAVTPTSTTINVGNTTNYANTVQGLMNAINGAGLGLTASFGTAAQAGSGAVATAAAAEYGGDGAADTGIIIAGQGVGSGTAAGEIASLTTLGVSDGTLDPLAGTLNIVGSNGASHTVTLGQADATDNLTNLAATINASGYGITAAVATNGSHISTLTFTSASSTASVTGTSLTDDMLTLAATPTTVSSALAPGSAGTVGTFTLGAAGDMLTGGTLAIVGNIAGANTFTLGTAGTTDNLTDLAKTINNWASLHPTEGITATVAGAVLTIANTLASGAVQTSLTAGTLLNLPTDSSVAATPTAVLLAGQPTPKTASSSTIGTLALTGAGTSVTDQLNGVLTFGGVPSNGGGVAIPETSITLGGTGTTDTLQDLAKTINSGAYGVTATYSQTNKDIVFTSSNGSETATYAAPGGVNGTGDQTTAAGVVAYTAAAVVTTAESYYSVGIASSGGINDQATTEVFPTTTPTTTYGGTVNTAITSDLNGSTGIATISYTDGAGQSLSSTDLSSQPDAEAALTSLNASITDVAAQDGYIGAQINTLNAVSSVLSTQSENVTSAQNAVQATDYASATSNMSKYEILSQTGISALAQANSMQQEVTKLLQ